ncbi:fimbrial protein [Pantoea sp. 1.19]|uniref:fimbrial protein n=1 Tax=Pantoea sp. 1.19 TaxID=1925589 RepID=UPI001F0B49A1|nr:fimbrial protein [Pantoea sp. 1.19]
MRMKKIGLATFICLFSLVLCQAATALTQQGQGRVNMQGSIVDTACAIAVDSQRQTVDMGAMSTAEVLHLNTSHDRPFTIRLVKCVTERPGKPDWRQFQVTFDGDADGTFFYVHGSVGGVALEIKDRQGNIAIPGKAMPLIDITAGKMDLVYTMRLISNHRPLKTGKFFSVIRFKLDYF